MLQIGAAERSGWPDNYTDAGIDAIRSFSCDEAPEQYVPGRPHVTRRGTELDVVDDSSCPHPLKVWSFHQSRGDSNVTSLRDRS